MLQEKLPVELKMSAKQKEKKQQQLKKQAAELNDIERDLQILKVTANKEGRKHICQSQLNFMQSIFNGGPYVSKYPNMS